MRTAGRISEWNDEKGFGFVAAHDDGARAFVHVKAFQSGSWRPVQGDLISYETVKDAKGRTNAVDVRFAGQRIGPSPPPPPRRAPRRRPLPVPRLILGVSALLAVAALAAWGPVPKVVAVTVWFFSLVSLIAYWWDKDSAQNNQWRTSEGTLHLMDLLGGWPGGLIAQQQFRHKISKASFQSAFWITVLLNIAALIAAVRLGWAQALSDWLI